MISKLKLEDFISKTKDGYNTNIDFAVVVGKINELVERQNFIYEPFVKALTKKHYWTEGLKEPDMIGEPDLIGGVEVPTKCFDPSNNYGTKQEECAPQAGNIFDGKIVGEWNELKLSLDAQESLDCMANGYGIHKNVAIGVAREILEVLDALKAL